MSDQLVTTSLLGDREWDIGGWRPAVTGCYSRWFSDDHSGLIADSQPHPPAESLAFLVDLGPRSARPRCLMGTLRFESAPHGALPFAFPFMDKR